MATLQEQYDDAVYEFTLGHTDDAIARFREILTQDPTYFDAQLALGNACYARGDYESAIAEGHRAEKLNPRDQLVHTNLSKAYMKAGNKTAAEHHALQSRIASWRDNMAPPAVGAAPDELALARPVIPPAARPAPVVPTNMPWKKQSAAGSAKAEPQFVAVAEAASLAPGHGRTVHVRGRNFALYNLDGEFFALDDACPHRGAPLGAGQLEGDRVSCPMHGWIFDLKTGACQSNPERPVKTHSTRLLNGQVEILVPA